MNNNFSEFSKRISNRFFFRQFLLSKLPAAFFAGLKIEAFNERAATVSVKYKWFNTNPFRSIYFAVLTMAGEMSTGLLCMGNVYNRRPAISMLVTGQRSLFHKKATGKVLFTCEDGNKIMEAVEGAVASGNAITVICHSKGINSNNELIAECWITWSFKSRNNKAVPLAV
ncbi:MAG TPA: thioesterase [Parafilimonas sp.]|nr:thioesterase [Parafilimonas sp.]